MKSKPSISDNKINYNYQPSYPSVSDNEEYGYEICPTNELTSKPNTRVETESNERLIDKLKSKISEQAKRLTELQMYKALCEKHILQICPNHSLPVKEEDITNFSFETFNNNLVNQLMNEKEQICNSLRNETLLNEEQRNYIEILKQTIESGLIKNGMSGSVQKAASAMKQSEVDFVIELTRVKGENEKIKKDLIMQQAVLNELKNDLESYKKNNDDLEIKNKSLIESLENEKEKNENLMQNRNKMIIDAQEQNEKMNLLLNDNQKMKENINELSNKINKYEIDLSTKKEIEATLSSTNDNYKEIQIKFNELKNEFNVLKIKYDKSIVDMTTLKNDNERLNCENAQKGKEIENLTNQLNENYVEHQNLINKHKDVQSAMQRTENNNKEITKEIQSKSSEVLSMKTLIKEKEREIYQLSSSLKELKSKMDIMIKDNESKIAYTNQNLQSVTIENENLKFMLDEKEKETNKLYTEISKLKQLKIDLDDKFISSKKANDDMIKSNNSLKDNLNQLMNERTSNINEIEQLKNSLTNASKEIKFWKEKYESDFKDKNDEEKNLKEEISNLNYKIEDLTRQYKKVVADNILKNEEITNADEREKKLRKEFNELMKNNSELNKSLEKHLMDLKREVHTSYDINTKNNALTIQLNELSIENQKAKKDLASLDELNKSLIAELETLRRSIKEKEIVLYSNSQNVNNQTKLIDSCYNSICEFVDKYSEFISKSGPQMYCAAIDDYILNFPKNQILLNDKIKQIENFVNVISTEAEILCHLYIEK